MSFLKFASDEVKEMASTLESSGGRMKGASKEMSRADAKAIGHGAWSPRATRSPTPGTTVSGSSPS